MTTEIQKLVIQKLTIAGKKYEYPDTTALVCKINELVDVVNSIVSVQEKLIDSRFIVETKHEELTENLQPDYVTTSYMTNGHTKEYYGQKGASVVTDYPLPEGYVITIKEPETKGDDNE